MNFATLNIQPIQFDKIFDRSFLFSQEYLILCSFFPLQFTQLLNYYNFDIVQIKMEQNQQLDDCFQLQLPIKKITQIIFLSSSQVIVLHIPHQYTVLQIGSRNNLKNIKCGKMPHLAQNVRRISNNYISFILENELHIFDVFEQGSILNYSIAKAPIYSQQFHYELYKQKAQIQLLFYKTSILKGTPTTVYYDIHQLALKQTLQKIKRVKVQHHDLRKFGVGCGQIFSYQLSGYQIEVIFLQSGITHKIQSIFNLFFMDIKTSFEQIEIRFTHDQLQNELSAYRITKKKITKMQRKMINPQKHTVTNDNKLRSLVFKNCYNQRKQDPRVAIFRMKAAKETKVLHLLENSILEETSIELKQMILNLLIQ